MDLSWLDPPRSALSAEERLAARLWRTREGVLIPVIEMTQRHVENAAEFADRMVEDTEPDVMFDDYPTETDVERHRRWCAWSKILRDELASRAFAHSIFPKELSCV